MMNGQFAYALTMGMVATVNPCGFAMLPAYLSFFAGTDRADGKESSAAAIARALQVSILMATGFLTVFGLIGIVFKGAATTFAKYAKWPTIGIGLVLIVVGLAMIAGWHLPWSTPRVQSGGKDRSARSVYLFGISYAIANISCGIALFLGLMTSTLTRSGFVSGVAVFVFYGLGMALVIGALTISLALAKQNLLRRLRSLVPRVDRIAGFFLVITGAYLVYYWTFNIATDYGTRTSVGGGLANRVEGWANSLQGWITDVGPYTLGAVLGGVLSASLLFVLVRRQTAA